MGRAACPTRHAARGSAPDPEALVIAEIDRCRRRLTLRAVLRRIALVLACGAAFPLLAVAGDHVWPGGLPRWLLIGAALVWAGTVTVVSVGLTFAVLARRLNSVFAARLLERVSGIRHNSLINILLLKTDTGCSYAVPAAAHQAARDVRTHDSGPLTEAGTWSAPLAATVVVFVAWLLYAFVSPKAVTPSVARFFGAVRPAPTATQLELLHPSRDEIVHVGDELPIEVAIRGQLVTEAFFDIFADAAETSDAAPARHNLRPTSSGPADRWQLTLAPHEVMHDIRFRCTAGDATLEGVIPVQPRPAITAIEIRLDWPPYTAHPPETVSNPDLIVLAGTRATWRLQANGAVQDPVFVLVGEREARTRMVVDPADPTRFGLSLTLMQGGEYRIEFDDRSGYPYRDPPEHSITVRPDAPPAVEIVTPTRDESPDDIVDVTRQPYLVATAADDIRIAELILFRARDGSKEPVPGETTTAADGRQARAEIKAASLGLRPGQSERVWFEARDNRVEPDGSPAFQTATSRVLTLIRPAATMGKGASPEPPDKTPPDENGQPAKGTDPAPGEQPAPADGQDGADGSAGQPTPAPSGTGSGDDKNGASPSNGATSTDGAPSADGAGLEGELERFVKEHGKSAREVVRRLNGGDQPTSQPTSQPSDQNGSAGQKSDASEESGEVPPSSPQTGQQPSDGSGPPSGGSKDTAGEGQPEPGRSPSDATGTDKSEQAGETPGDGAKAASGEPSEPASTPPPASQPSEPEPPDDANAAPLDSDGRAETIDLLGMLRRGEELNEDDLVELGWSAPQAAAFIEALQRVYEVARKSGQLDNLKHIAFDAPVGDDGVQRGAGLAESVTTGVESNGGDADGLGQIAAPPEQQVPPHLRALLDAYYRSLAQRRGEHHP